MPRVKKVLGIITILIGIGIILYPGATILYGSYRQAMLRKEWEQRIKQKPVIKIKKKDNDSQTQVKKEFLPTRMLIPKIGVDQIVQEGISTDVLASGPGHYPTTVCPGQIGYCAIAGHRVTHSRPFNRLDELNNDDVIILETPEEKLRYRVFETKLVPSSEEFKLEPTKEARLALTTCAPEYSDTQRLVVRAVLFWRADRP